FGFSSPRNVALTVHSRFSYVESRVAGGAVEYNNGTINVRSKHPLDECLRWGIIEEQHHESGKRIKNYRDCAMSKLPGRTYNATGDGDSEMDAATIYANVMRAMNAASGSREQWKLISIVCFIEPDIDGEYFSEMDYRALS